jgi:hypothetical protein
MRIAVDDTPRTLFGYALPHLDQILRQEHVRSCPTAISFWYILLIYHVGYSQWLHTFFLMLPASLVSCIIVNTAASFIRGLMP